MLQVNRGGSVLSTTRYFWRVFFTDNSGINEDKVFDVVTKKNGLAIIKEIDDDEK